MAITFVKDTNGKVIVDDGVKVFSLDPSMNVIAHSADPELIVITDTSAPLETREAFKFGWQQVSTPANTSRNDLIEKLGKNFFYSSVAVSIPTDLAKEAKQDMQITLATALNGYVDGIEALLTSINGKDFATESTLTQIKGYVDNIETLLTSIDGDTANLDVSLSTRASEATLIQVRDYLDTVETKLSSIITNTTGLNLEATQLLIKGVLDLIKAKTDNLDVALSTRLSKIDFEARINTLGQKTSANSTPVVLPSDQIIKTTEDLGANENHATIAASTSSTLLIAANANRKEVVIYNDSNKQMSICPFTPAVYGTGFIVPSKTGWVIDTTQSALYGIWDTGATGNALIQEIYE